MNARWFDHHQFFAETLKDADATLFTAIELERSRQHQHIELIASENMVSRAVLQAQGSVLTNKYAEGYVGKRYYGGCHWVDEVERLAIERARLLFKAQYANVQPHSGAQANGAVMLALLQPGDTILGMSLDAGGHLTHGAKPALSGKWFNAIQYGIDASTEQMDYDAIDALAQEHKPKLIIAGGSAVPREINFERFRKIADRCGALLMVDMAHIAGLIAAGEHPSPFPHAHVVTSTTHKTLRGPRGGLILTNDEALFKKINSAVFPGLQGGPLMHVIAGKAVALGEALAPNFSSYIKDVVVNAKVLANTLTAAGIDLVTGGTDTHLLLVDLRKQGLTGKAVEEALESVHVTCNKNGVPNDPQKPTVTSGIRLGTAAATSRGFGQEEFRCVANIIIQVIDLLQRQGALGSEDISRLRAQVAQICDAFPVYQSFN